MTRRASEGQEDRALEIFEDLKRQGFWLEGYTNIRIDFTEWAAYRKVAERLIKENWPEDVGITAAERRRDSGSISSMVERARRRRSERMEDSVLPTQRIGETVAVMTPLVDRKGTWVWASQVESERARYTGKPTGSFSFRGVYTSSRDIRIGTVTAERFFYQSLRDVPASGTIVADIVILE